MGSIPPSPPQIHVRSILNSLRFRLGVGILVLVTLALILQFRYHAIREQQGMEAQLINMMEEFAQMVFGGLHRSMQANNFERAGEIMHNLTNLEDISAALIVDINGKVILDSTGNMKGKVLGIDEQGCTGCHSLPVDQRPKSIRVSDTPEMLRLGLPIARQPECMECHTDSGPHLGMFVIDVTTASVHRHVNRDYAAESITVFLAVLLLGLGIYFLVDWIVVRRIEAFQKPLNALTSGDLSARVPEQAGPPGWDRDEIGRLAQVINYMAATVEQHAAEQEERGLVRQQAISDERQRIASELHDGLAQLLGYVSTKAGAVRANLENQQIDAARAQLGQLEEAARELFVDVREAILGLKISSETGAGLVNNLHTYSRQFTRLSGIPTECKAGTGLDDLHLSADVELQIMRIVQESLSNIRKHAGASHVKIDFGVEAGQLQVTIQDDGKGFDPRKTQPLGRAGYGMGGMQERARMIGAVLVLESELGRGTQISLRMPAGKEH